MIHFDNAKAIASIRREADEKRIPYTEQRLKAVDKLITDLKKSGLYDMYRIFRVADFHDINLIR